jgi:hypothetical protein
MAQLNSKKMRDIHLEALQRFQTAFSAEEKGRKKARDDIRFATVDDGQWDDIAKKRRRDRPRYTINKIAATIREINGDYRQNRIELKLRAKTDSAKDIADTAQGLAKAIVSTSSAELASDTAFNHILLGGLGAWRVWNDFTADSPFDQDIVIKPIFDPLTSVWWDPNSKEPTGKDATYCFVVKDMPREEFERKYPKADFVPFSDARLTSLQRDWCNKDDDTLRVAEYIVRKPVEIDVVRLSDGRVITLEDFEAAQDELAAQGIGGQAVRKKKTFKVTRYMLNGSQMLEQPAELPTKFIPIVRVLGYYHWFENCLRYQGIVRNARDAQRVYNYAVSANIEATALAPKDKILYTPKMIKGFEREWASMNVSNSPGLPYNHDAASGGAPQPLSFAQMPNTALVQQSQQAELDIQATMGRRAPAQGEAPSDKSGRAILALQRQSDQSTFELQSNLALSKEYTGEIIMDMMPRIYDAERQVNILGDDDKAEVVFINQTVQDDAGNDQIVNDLSISDFDVIATVGPAYETKRTEAVNVLANLADNPQFGPVIPDLLAKSLDFPFAEELEQRMRKMLIQQGIVEPNEEEAQAMNTPQAQMQQQIQMQQLQMQMQQQQELIRQLQLQNDNLAANTTRIIADTDLKGQSAQKENAEIESTRVKNYTDLLDALVKKAEAGLPIDPNEVVVMKQTLELLSANIAEDELLLIQQNLNRLQNTQQQIG